MPYAALAFLLLFGFLLTDRFVRALNASERLNADLERRVVEKSEALSAQLEVSRAARNVAEAANRAKSSFLAAASHDLRQPLHALGMFAQALTDRTRDTEGQHLAQRIASSVNALVSMMLGGTVLLLSLGALLPRLVRRFSRQTTTASTSADLISAADTATGATSKDLPLMPFDGPVPEQPTRRSATAP